jgi:hypothetical protein
MMNPEFKRNLWLSFSRHKLIAMPVLLALVFLAIAISDKNTPQIIARNLYIASTGLFIFIVWLWGARNANLSIVDELRDKTWDQQRMSALGPWAMTWGKLLGATSFNWYGGAFCLAVAIPAAIYDGRPAWMLDVPALIAGGLMLHSGLMALNMHSGQIEASLIQRGGLGWVAIVFTLFSLQAISSTALMDHEIAWWGIGMSGKLFVLASTVLFATCAVFAAWRIISNALQVRTIPWAWPLLALILTGYFSGFSPHLTGAWQFWYIGSVGLVVSLIMTYATLLTEPMSLPDWNKLRLRQQRGDWRGWLQHLPLWPTTLFLAFCFGTLAMLPGLPGNDTPATFFHLPITLALMALRDAAIVLFFSLSARAKRPAAVAVLYLIVLNGLLPFLFKQAGMESASFFFLPMDERYGAMAPALVLTTHAVIALGLVGWRLQKVKLANVA